ncbi:MAG: hypothetical protein ACTTHG_01965 [Treponemataceae bacterium]
MKINSKIKIYTIFAAFVCTALLLGCNGDESRGWGPIFYNISNEKKLEEPIVKGNITSMVETSDKIFCTNGYIWVKAKFNSKGNLVERGWTLATLPSICDASNTVVRLASTDTNLFCYVFKIETRQKRLFMSPVQNKLNWKEIAVNTTGNFDLIELFDNNATPGINRRKAYYTTVNIFNPSDYKIFEINSDGSGTEITSTVKANRHYTTWNKTFSATDTAAPVKAAWISNSNTTIFSNDALITSDRQRMFYHVADGTKRNDRVVAYSTDGVTWHYNIAPDLGKVNFLVASYYKDEVGNGFIYLGKTGTTPGLLVVKVNGTTGEPTKTLCPSVGSNYSSCPGDMNAIGIFSIPLGSGSLYVASVTYLSTKAISNLNKLWGYYPIRPNGNKNIWNCE